MQFKTEIFDENQDLVKKMISDIHEIIFRINTELIKTRETSVAITHLETAQLWLTQCDNHTTTPA